MRFKLNTLRIFSFLCAATLGVAPALATDRLSVNTLLSMGIKDLVNVKVTSLSKHEERYMSTAGAVFVISNDDIRRSGARSIPDALRLAPGLQVSQTNMNQYQIGIRGQTDFFTDLLLVMIDGRPIYTTTFSGVWWVAQNYPLEGIERIEVVRGPGGAVWGSNAVNGVINIITKDAAGLRGLRFSAGAGTEDKGFGNISYGSSLGKLDFRLYGMNELRDGGLADRIIGGFQPGEQGYKIDDDMPDFRRMNQQGFRMDWQANNATLLSLHGDAYHITTGVSSFWMPIVTTPAQAGYNYNGLNTFNGKNLVFRIENKLRPGITLKGQLIYDQYRIDTKIVHENKETFDGEFQVDFSEILKQRISLGVNVRQLHARYDNTPQFQMPSRTTGLTSFFINDTLSLFDDLFQIIGGVKMERNSYTDWVYQPSARAIISNDYWALWVSASQAARTPNDMENGLIWNVKRSSNMLVKVIGDAKVAQTEKVTSYEIGGRVRPSEDMLIELTAFKIFYKGVLDTWLDTDFSNPYLAQGILPVYLTNVLNGRGDGLEVNFRYQPQWWVTLKGSYTYLHQTYVDYPIQDRQTASAIRSNKGQDPNNRFHVGVSLNPITNVELDANLYFTGPFREGAVAGYHRFDLRLAWKPKENLEIELVGQDMLQASHKSNVESVMGAESKIQQRYYMSAAYHYD